MGYVVRSGIEPQLTIPGPAFTPRYQEGTGVPATRRGVLALATSGVYVGTALQGELTGPTWVARTGGLAGSDLQILHLELDQPHGDRGYIATEDYTDASGNLWRHDSLATGGNWTQLTPAAPAGYAWTNAALYVYKVAHDPGAAGTVYAIVNYLGAPPAVGSWLYKSTDAGATWASTVIGAVGTGTACYGFSVCPTDSTRAWALVSINGRPWDYLVTALNGVPVWTVQGANYGIAGPGWIKAVPGDATIRYAFGNLGVNRYLIKNRITTVWGTSIERLVSAVESVVVESATRVRGVTGSVNQWFCGTDDGATEAFIRPLPALLRQACWGINDWYYVGGAGGVYATADDGLNWTDITGALPADTVRHIKMFGLGVV